MTSRPTRPTRRYRIGIDVAWADGRFGGTGIYTTELVKALVGLDTTHDYVLYFSPLSPASNPLWQLNTPFVTRRIVNKTAGNARSQMLAYYLYRDRIDLFHSLGFFLPYLWYGKKVVTIHDVNYLRFRDHWWRKGKRSAFLSLLIQTPLSALQSHAVITVSQFAARDVQSLLPVGSDKLAVIYNGIRPIFTSRADAHSIEHARRRFRVTNYILYVGVLSPQKNLDRLVRAFAQLVEWYKAAGLYNDIPQLVLVGSDDGEYSRTALRDLVHSLNLVEQVRFTGYVTDDELRALYSAALCTVQISEGEGFGLPVVESMALGTPVLVGADTATAEITGDAALPVATNDIDSIAQGLLRLCQDGSMRMWLINRGVERARSFAWNRSAAATLSVYRRVLGESTATQVADASQGINAATVAEARTSNVRMPRM